MAWQKNGLSTLLSAVILLLGSQALQAEAPRIAEIVVTGIKNTQPEVVREISKLKVDQQITDALLVEAQQRVHRQGVFDEVEVSRRPSSREGFVIVEIRVKEKISWFAVPYLSYSDDNFSVGGAVGETNFLGRLKKIVLFADWGPDTKRALLAYRDPHLAGSKFTLATDFAARKVNMREYDADRNEVRRVRVEEVGFTLMPGYQWSDHFGVSLGPFFRNVSQKQISPTVGGAADQNLRTVDLRGGNDVSLMLKLTYDNRNFKEGFSEGSKVEFETQVSDNRFGSKYDYYRQILRLSQSYYLIPHILNFKHNFSVQLGLTLPFYRELMLGGSNLRGFVETQFRGDTRYSLNNEVWFPLFDWKFLVARGITFWDSGILYLKDREFNRDRWNNGIGGGMRFYIRGINIPVLGYDFAYGIEDGVFGGYLKVGAAF